jgi:hypothetical protein
MKLSTNKRIKFFFPADGGPSLPAKPGGDSGKRDKKKNKKGACKQDEEGPPVAGRLVIDPDAPLAGHHHRAVSNFERK